MPEYVHNPVLFAEFYSVQRELALELGRHPDAVSSWLSSRRQPRRCTASPAPEPAGWRTARLTGQRLREVQALLRAGSEIGPWLLASLPVGPLLEIAERAAIAGQLAADVLARRERLFHNNLGLAKAAALSGRPEDYGDRLSAACSGLLDAIDRYVPGEGSARFAYFAKFWIRYHIYRYVEKHGSVVAYPIYQQRLRRRLGRPQFERPQIISLQGTGAPLDEDGAETPLQLEDPGPSPGDGAAIDGAAIAVRIRTWLRRSLPPDTRLMLAYTRSIGPLADAADDYLASQREKAREQLGLTKNPRC